MGVKKEKEYPKRPVFIAGNILGELFLVIPTCFVILFVRGGGFIVSGVMLGLWIWSACYRTQKRWEGICDGGVALLEVDHAYLLSQGFYCLELGQPVIKMTEEVKQALIKAAERDIEIEENGGTEDDPYIFRRDPKNHKHDKWHSRYSETTVDGGVWLTEEEEKILSDEIKRQAQSRQKAKAIRLKIEYEYGHEIHDAIYCHIIDKQQDHELISDYVYGHGGRNIYEFYLSKYEQIKNTEPNLTTIETYINEEIKQIKASKDRTIHQQIYKRANYERDLHLWKDITIKKEDKN